MSDRHAYSRIYWSVMDDPKFDGIREDSKLFGSWSLLLVIADMAYPSPAYLPPTVSKAALSRLVDATLVDLLPGHRYRIRGLAAERGRRSESARVGGLASGRSRSVERPLNERSRSAGTISNLDEAEAGDENRDEAQTPRAPDPADVYWTLTGRYPTDKALSWVDDLSASYGAEAVVKALAASHLQDRSANTLLGRTEDVLRHEARILSLKDQAATRARIKERRAEPRPEVDRAAIDAEIRRLMEPGAAA